MDAAGFAACENGLQNHGFVLLIQTYSNSFVSVSAAPFMGQSWYLELISLTRFDHLSLVLHPAIDENPITSYYSLYCLYIYFVIHLLKWI